MAGSTPVELVKEKLDIVEFLRGYLTLQPAGRNFKALCPFHKEKTPSFSVSPERQTWHCFGCGIGGDVFSFLMRYEQVEFGEALRILAEKAGVELRHLNPAEYKYTGLLLELNELAKEFFKKQLATSAAKPVQEYLRARKLQPGTIEEFELGWAPPDGESLVLHFLNRKYRPEDLIQAGLVFKTERGKQLDRFRGRIMFPIHNHFGKVVGFTGRILPQLDNGQTGKYVNSPETPVFNKSRLLYGFWKTKTPIRETGSAFLVEGQMDFLMSWQSGITNAVASSGTALTPEHLRTLRRATEKIVLSFDNDEAGLAAGERAIDLAEANDFEVRVAVLGEAKDPGELAEKDPAALVRAVSEAIPAPEFYFDRYLPAGRSDFRERDFLRRLRTVLGKLVRISSPVARSFWFGALAKRVGVEEKVLREEAEQLAPAGEERTAAPPSAEPLPERTFTRWELLTQQLLAAAAAKADFGIVGTHVAYLAQGYGDVLSLLQRGERKSAVSADDELLNLILLRTEERAEAEIEALKEQLFREYLRERRRELTDLVRRAEAARDDAALQAAMRELQDLPIL